MRRDFSALMKCQGCGHEQEEKGCYDDENYHVNVVPTIKCGKCGKTAQELNAPLEPFTLKYNPNQTV